MKGFFMTKKKIPGRQSGPLFPGWYAHIMAFAMAALCLTAPALAASDLWTIANNIIVDVYNNIANISVQGATNDIKKCFRYAEWKSQIFHSIFTYSLVALIDEIKPSVAFLLSSKLIFSQSSR